MKSFSVISLCLLTLPLAAQSTPSVLPKDTRVELKLSQTISSANEEMGNLVGFVVVDDVKVGDVVVIAHGAEAIGHVTDAKPKKWAGRGGRLRVDLDYVRLPNGDKLGLSGVQSTVAGGHSTTMTGAMVGTAIVFWPAAPLFLMMHGKEVVLPQGTVVESYTMQDVPVGKVVIKADPSTVVASQSIQPAP